MMFFRLSGYILLALMLFTVGLAGNEAYWVIESSPTVVRFLAYSLAPAVILGGVYSRVRSVYHLQTTVFCDISK